MLHASIYIYCLLKKMHKNYIFAYVMIYYI